MSAACPWIVLGLGNLLCSDDGLGVRAIQALEQDPRVPPGTLLLDGGTLGIQLAAYIEGNCRLLLLDAVDVGASPGTVILLHQDQLRRLAGAKTAHDLGLAELLAALRLLGQEPQEALLLGIQPAVTTPGIHLSPSVAAAFPLLLDATLALLRESSLSSFSLHLYSPPFESACTAV